MWIKDQRRKQRWVFPWKCFAFRLDLQMWNKYVKFYAHGKKETFLSALTKMLFVQQNILWIKEFVFHIDIAVPYGIRKWKTIGNARSTSCGHGIFTIKNIGSYTSRLVRDYSNPLPWSLSSAEVFRIPLNSFSFP